MSHQVNYLALMRDRKFAPVFWTQFLGAFNDNVFKTGITMLIAFGDGHPFVENRESGVSLAMGIFILPFFLLSAYAGLLSDKFSKARLMRATKIWEIFVMLIGSVGFLTTNMTLLFITLFMMGAQSTFFGPAKYSILPEVLDKDTLMAGNALVESGTFVSILLGLIVGGAVGDLRLLSAIVILIAVAGYLASLKIPKLGARSPTLNIRTDPFRPTFTILLNVARHSVLLQAILSISWFWLMGAVILNILPTFVKEVLGGNENTVVAFLTVFTFGIGAGSILCERFSKGRVRMRSIIIGAVGMSATLGDLYLASLNLPAFSDPFGAFKDFRGLRIAFDMLLFAGFAGLFTVPVYTVLQQRSPEDSRSRYIAGNNIVNSFLMVVGSVALVGLYKLEFNYADIFLILALSNLVVVALIFGGRKQRISD